ncbi:hypothetical protein AM499_04475 [Bacillus sp. FJAT-22090]|nr:hypothetical protein AM499_04475 [Bacillus sp. FJAT-22090]
MEQEGDTNGLFEVEFTSDLSSENHYIIVVRAIKRTPIRENLFLDELILMIIESNQKFFLFRLTGALLQEGVKPLFSLN